MQVYYLFIYLFKLLLFNFAFTFGILIYTFNNFIFNLFYVTYLFHFLHFSTDSLIFLYFQLSETILILESLLFISNIYCHFYQLLCFFFKYPASQSLMCLSNCNLLLLLLIFIVSSILFILLSIRVSIL